VAVAGDGRGERVGAGGGGDGAGADVAGDGRVRVGAAGRDDRLAVGVRNFPVRRRGRRSARDLDGGGLGVVLHVAERDDDVTTAVGRRGEGLGHGDVLAAGALEDVVTA